MSAPLRRAARSHRRDRGNRRPEGPDRTRSWDQLTPTVSQASCRAQAMSTARQIIDRIRRLAVLADLEVELIAARAARSHLGDRLAGFHLVAFLHEPLLVVAVRGEKRGTVLDDDQLAVADQAIA